MKDLRIEDILEGLDLPPDCLDKSQLPDTSKSQCDMTVEEIQKLWD